MSDLHNRKKFVSLPRLRRWWEVTNYKLVKNELYTEEDYSQATSAGELKLWNEVNSVLLSNEIVRVQ